HNNGPANVIGNAEIQELLALGEEFKGVHNDTGAFSCSAVPAAWSSGVRQLVTCTLNTYPLALDQTRTLQLVTRARELGMGANNALINQACTGGSMPPAYVGATLPKEPTTDTGVNADKVTTNDCAGGDGVAVTQGIANLKVSKETQAPLAGDRVLKVTDAAMSYIIKVTNTGDATAGVVVNDKIPGWSSFTKATVTNTAGWDCTATETVICRSNATVMASGAENTITIKLTHTDGVSPGFLVDSVGKVAACPNPPPVAVDKPHFHCNTVGVGIDGAQLGSLGEGDWSDNYASDWVSAERYANMKTQSKSITSGSNDGQAGVNAVYRVEYRNDGPSAVPGVVMRDTFKLLAGDAGFVLIEAKTAGGVTCSNVSYDPGIVPVQGQGGISYSNSNTSLVQTLTVACPATDFSAGSAQTLNIVIRPNVNSGNTGRYVDNTGNFIINTGTGADYHGTDANGDFIYNSNTSALDDTKDEKLTFKQGEADLAVQKKDVFDSFKDPIGYDGTQPAKNVLTYMLEVTNGGPSIATNVVAKDWLTPPDGKTVTFVGASDTSSTSDADYGSTLCAVQGPATVTGNSAGTAKLHVICTMPGAGYGANNAPGVISSTTGQNKSSVYLRYRYETEPGASGDTVYNQVVVSSSERDPQSDNDDVTETTTLYMTADMGVAKTMVTTAPSVDPSVALPPSIAVVSINQAFWYVLTATNHGSGQSLARDRTKAAGGGGTVIVDTLPDGVVVTDPSKILWQKTGPVFTGATPTGSGTCTLVSRTITCEVGDVTFASGNPGTVRIIVPSRWDDLPAGSTAPLGTSQNTAKVTTEQIDPNPGNDSTTVPLDVVNLSIAGYVFVDSNGGASDGIKQGAETGINNVTITLTGKDFNGAEVNRTLITASGGAYRFDNLPPSDGAGYTVTQSHVAGYSNGLVAPPTAGADSATFNPGSYLAAVNSTYVAVVTPTVVASLGTIGTKGATAINYNFPKVQAVTLSGYVYADIGLNDVRDVSTDPAISPTTVELLDAGGNVIDSETTDGDGYYLFTELHPGLTYSLREPLPAGYQDRPSAINPGQIGGVLCTACTTQTVATNASRIDNIKLVAGNGTEFNFGEAQVASVAGVVYVDREDPTGTGLYDGNGAYNAGVDRGLAGVAIRLYDESGTTLLSETTTDASGAYGFVNFSAASGKVIAGAKYQIRQTQPSALRSGQEANSNVIDTIAVPALGLFGQNFGEIAGSISGRVYLDAANDGVYAATDLDLDGVSVSLGAGVLNVFGEAVTAQQTVAGKYVFRDLPNGSYAVTEQTQPLYNTVTTLNGATNAGTVSVGGTAGQATTKSVVPSAISGITLLAGGSSVDNNFGEILPVSVAGTVFMDVNNDGAMSGAAEVGLDGVLIQLTGVDDLGPVTTTMVVPVNTANGGKFLFEGLRPGTYVLTEPTQPTGTANGITTAGTVSGTTSGTATLVTTLPSAISAISLTVPGGASIDNLFGETPRDSSISGKVWLDTNDDGVVGGGENGLGGVTVTLEGTATDGSKISETVTTNPDGSYAFVGLPP
ncbi:MAG: SdrD B-like domain-containing protein, partial [Stenotrophomonas sp.]